MRFNITKTEEMITAETNAAELEDLVGQSKLQEFWTTFQDSSPADIKNFLQDKLSPYPPSQTQWILLLKLIGFILVLLKVLVKKAGIK